MNDLWSLLVQHPSPALAGAIALGGTILLVYVRRQSRRQMLPSVMASALFAFAAGIANAQIQTIHCFQAMALVGTGGVGALAAGLSEARFGALAGSVAALTVLVVGAVLSLTGSVHPEPAGTVPGGKPRSHVPLLAVAIFATVAGGGLAGADYRLAAVCAHLLHGTQLPPFGADEAARQLSHGLLTTTVLAVVLAGAGVVLAFVAQLLVTPPRLQAGSRLVVGGLLLLMAAVCVSTATAAGSEQSRLWNIALTGRAPD